MSAMTTQPRADDEEDVARPPPPIVAMLVLAGSTLPITAFSCSRLLDAPLVTPMTGIEIANLVILTLQLVMQIVQFVFIIEQIFVWESAYAPDE